MPDPCGRRFRNRPESEWKRNGCFYQSSAAGTRAFTAAKILASAGNVNISDSTISDLDVQSNAGNIVFDEIESDQIKLDIDYGNLEISDSQVKKISVDADAGKIDINDIQSDDITIDADYGSTDLKMIGNEDDYDIEVEVDYGDFSLNGKDQNNKYKANNDKEKKIKINSDAGDVNIRFE